MDNNTNNLSIVIPIYNEEASIQNTMDKLKNTLDPLQINYEIIAVNDASKDKSGDILKEIKGIQVLTHSQNQGYGASLKTGIRNAKYNHIMITDCDGTYPIESIESLIEKSNQYDQVIGSREKPGNQIPIERKLAKKILNKFASYLAGHKIPDLNSGMRIFKKDIVVKYWNFFPNRFSFTSTMTMICLTKGYSTLFVPINYHKRTGKSSIKPRDFFNFIKLITKLSLFFKPIKVFAPISLLILIVAIIPTTLFFMGLINKFPDTTITLIVSLALQTFFFGLLAEIVIHQKK